MFDYILANRFLKEKDASRLFAQLISGVDYLHQKHIVHRDLKLENLLLDRHRNIIITDFGFANRFERDGEDLMATSCGSPCYAAPELVVSEGLYVGTAVDVWSCGVILYAMLSGYLPYDDDPDNPDGDNINLLYKYIMSTPLNFPDHMSRMAMDLLLMMLVPNPQERCSIAQIEVHPWLEAHQSIFDRSVEEHERVFTENMHQKSQQAKRDLAQRRRMQQEAKLVKALQRSHSTAPNSAAALDAHRRTKEQRHRSALPGTSTMPDYLYNAGHQDRFPTLESRPEHQAAPSAIPDQPLPPLPTPTKEPIAEPASDAKGPTTPPQTPPRPRTTSAQGLAVDQEMAEPVTPPRRASHEPKTPMSANKNRHTIQVEYDGDRGWERFKNLQPTDTKPGDIVDAPAKALDVPQIGDMEVESASEMESKAESRTNTPPAADEGGLAASPVIASAVSSEPAQAEPASTSEAIVVDGEPAAVATTEKAAPPAATPSAEEGPSAVVAPPPRPPRRPPSLPQTPSKRSREMDDVPAVSTPKTSAPTESQTATPKADPRTPTQATRLPPGAETPKRQASATLPEIAESPVAAAPPRPPKRDRQTRRGMGMSLDKFGLAKLLGQSQPPASTNSRPSYIPVSQHSKSHSVAFTSSTAAPPATQSPADKKARRKTVQLMNAGSRTSTPDNLSSRASATSSVSNKDGLAIGPQGIQPRPSQDQQSSTSVVTVDAFGDSNAQRTASSSAAKRVMDWFRRKSLAKDTLTTIKTGSVRADSLSSAGRPSMSGADRGYVHIAQPRDSMDVPHTFVRDESIGPHTNGPSIVVSDSPTRSSPERKTPERKTTEVRRKQPESQKAVETSPPEKRTPLAPANSKANIEKKLLSPERAALPTRSKSVRTPHGMHQSLAGSTIALVNPHSVADSVRQGNGAPSAESSKMRVHTGLVDQSALTSRPPPEVMAEVVRVLHSMGIDVKQEADYRLRCTRVRRRKAGPTTGLSTGAAGLGSMSLTSAANKNSEGRPLPSTGSGGLSGLKGMLLRRGSSYSSYSSAALARSESDLLASVSTSTTPQLASPNLGPTPEPLYGEHSIDNGDEVKFVVELCRIKNLQGLYLLNIKRLRGSVWSFKFIYQTIVERCETLTH